MQLCRFGPCQRDILLIVRGLIVIACLESPVRRSMVKSNRRSRLEAFGRAVKVKRLTLDLTQEELAHRSGLDRTYIGGVERGERNVGLLNIVLIAEALGISAGDLMHASDIEVAHGSIRRRQNRQEAG